MKTTKLKADALCAVILLLPDVFVSPFFGSYIFDVIFATLLLFVINSHYRFLLFCIFFTDTSGGIWDSHLFICSCFDAFLCLESQFV